MARGVPTGRENVRSGSNVSADNGGARVAPAEGLARGDRAAGPRHRTTMRTAIIVDTSVTPSLTAASGTSRGFDIAPTSEGGVGVRHRFQPGTTIDNMITDAPIARFKLPAFGIAWAGAPAARAIHAQRVSTTTTTAHGTNAAHVAGPTKENRCGRNTARPRVGRPRSAEGAAVVDRQSAAARALPIDHYARRYRHRQ